MGKYVSNSKVLKIIDFCRERNLSPIEIVTHLNRASEVMLSVLGNEDIGEIKLTQDEERIKNQIYTQFVKKVKGAQKRYEINKLT